MKENKYNDDIFFEKYKWDEPLSTRTMPGGE